MGLGFIGNNIITKDGVVQFEYSDSSRHRIFIDTSTVQGQLDAFRKCGTIQSAMNKRSSAIKNLEVWARDENKRKVNNPTVISDLKKLEHPNPKQNFDDFNVFIDTNCIAHGVAYVYKKKIVGFNETHNYIIPNELIIPIYENGYKVDELFEIEPSYYNVLLPSGTPLRLERDEVVIFRDNWIRNLMGIHGLSRFHALQDEILTILSAKSTISALYSEGGMRGILSLGANQRETLSSPLLNKDKIDLQNEIKQYGQMRGQFHYIIAKSAINYTPITSKIIDMQLPENLKMAQSAIYEALGVPNAYLEMETRYKALPDAEKFMITSTICPEISSRYDEYVKMMGIPERNWEYYPDYSHLPFYQLDLQQAATAMLNASTAYKNLKEAGVDKRKIDGFIEQFFE